MLGLSMVEDGFSLEPMAQTIILDLIFQLTRTVWLRWPLAEATNGRPGECLDIFPIANRDMLLKCDACSAIKVAISH